MQRIEAIGVRKFTGYDGRVSLRFGELPKLLRRLRKRAGLTQEEAGAKVDVSHQTVGNWEGGSREPPFSKLSKLLAAYGVEDFAALQRELDAMRSGAPEEAEPEPTPPTDESRIIKALLRQIAELESIQDKKQGG